MTTYSGNSSSFHYYDISDLNWSVDEVSGDADSQTVVLNATAAPGKNHTLFGDNSYLSFRVSSLLEISLKPSFQFPAMVSSATEP